MSESSLQSPRVSPPSSATPLSSSRSSSSLSSPALPSSTLPSEVAHPRVEDLKALLECTLRIRCSDGRIFIGTFVCVDKQLNIILSNTDEYRIDPETGRVPGEGRYVTMVMVPWKFVINVAVQNYRAYTGSLGL